MPGLAELFIVGTMPFWLLILAEVVLLFIFVAYENGIGATLSLVAFGAILQFCGGVDIVGYVIHHPFQLAGLVVAYFVVGTIWGVIKWWLYVNDKLQVYEDLKIEWLRSKGHEGTNVVPDELKADWKAYLEDERYAPGRRAIAKQPLAREHKGRIMNWMAFWVPSVLYSLFNDFIRRVFQSIYYRIARELQKISDKVFAHVKNDMVAEVTAQQVLDAQPVDNRWQAPVDGR